MKKPGRPSKYVNINENIKRLYNAKNGLKNIELNTFIKWYENQNESCIYCGINSTESILLFNTFPESTRGGRRGMRLELDRKDSKIINYGEDINNLVLACYWCNNAKTNYFTYEEFKIIGKSLSIIQKERLNQIKLTNEK